jgi:hypothetical protein
MMEREELQLLMVAERLEVKRKGKAALAVPEIRRVPG